jgi:hypothetical protein
MRNFAATDRGRIGTLQAPSSTIGAQRTHDTMPLVVSLTTLLLKIFDAPYWMVWVALLCTAALVFRSVATSVVTLQVLPAPSSNWQKISAATLVIFGAILVAITHRSDLDDSQYLNFVVTAMDFPAEALFSHSGLWQDHSTPLEMPIYRLHSYELLVAALSYAFGVDHKLFYYLVLPPIFGSVAVLLHWRLARYFMPRHALSMLLAWLVLIIALGESHRTFGNFAFVRLYQGKALLVTVALPLCLYLGLRFAEAPDWRRALSLSMSVMTSLGMSSSALATVPVLAAAVIGGGLPGASRDAFKRLVAGGLASLLVLIAIGVFILITISANGGIKPGPTLPAADYGLSFILGEGSLGALVLALFPVAPLFVSDNRRRKLYALTTLYFVVGVLNPWTAPFIAKMLDAALQWRLFWSVPFVISASISLTGLTTILANKLRTPERHFALPFILIAILLLSTQLSISPGNQVVFAFPRYKVEPSDHALAAEIVHDAPKRSTIYAPNTVSAWITTFRQHPYPLIVRHMYLDFGQIRNHFGEPELQRRKRVINFLEGNDTNPSTIAFFQEQLASDRPAFVAYENRVDSENAIYQVLTEAGYVGERRGNYWLWKRK